MRKRGELFAKSSPFSAFPYFFFTPKIRRSRGARKPGDFISTIFIASLLQAVFSQCISGAKQQPRPQYAKEKFGQNKSAQRPRAKGGQHTAVVWRYGQRLHPLCFQPMHPSAALLILCYRGEE